MAERVFFPSAEETPEEPDSGDEKSTKKKKKKSSRKLGASVVSQSSEQSPEQSAASEVAKEKPKEEPIDRLIADLLLEKDEKKAENAKAESIFAGLPLEKPNESIPAEEALVVPPSAEVVEYMRSRELAPDELSGGEVIIRLHEDVETPAEATDVLAYDAPVELSTQKPEAASEVGMPEDDEPIPTTPFMPMPSSGSGGGSRSGGSGSGSGGSGGRRTPPPTPPTPPNPFSSPNPTPPNRTPVVTAPSRPNLFNTAPLTTAAANFNQLLQTQLSAEAARNRLRGRGEGLLAGLLIGGGIEHFRHKSRERKMEKKAVAEQKKQSAKLETVEFKARQDQIEAAREAERVRYAHKDALKAETAAVAKAQLSEASAINRVRTAEKLTEQQEKEKAELIERLNAQAAAQEAQAEKIVADENRLETSAWHVYEVDKQGNAVQESSIEYGHEYYQERAAETGPKDQQLGVKAGSTALTAAVLQNNPHAGSTGSPVMQQGGQTSSGQPILPASPQSPAQNTTLGLPPMLGMPSDASYIDNDTHQKASPASPIDDGKTPSAGLMPWIIALIVIGVLIAVLS